MTIFQTVAIVLTITALFSYVNFRFFRLPTTIGVMLISLVASLALLALELVGVGFDKTAAAILREINFDDTVMQGMLSFLLFAGALHINIADLSEQKSPIAILAVAGVVVSTFVFGTAIYYVLVLTGLAVPYDWCLLFGALISPTDPIAVLGILKTTKVPRVLEIKIAAESLFNDGIGVVAFILLSEVTLSGRGLTASHFAVLFATEAIGGAALGFVLGWVTYRLLKSVDNYQVEVLLTLALVTGGYALAQALHASGPIAIVVAGVLIGNHGRQFAMSSRTREHLDIFWELVDEILNAVLFVLIGLEVLEVAFTGKLLIAGLAAVPALLLARWLSVAAPIGIMGRWRTFSPGTVRILTWGGLRGGISVAMALSLPSGRERQTILAVTYVLVVFSVLVQGLTFRRLVTAICGDERTA
jgi:CPA1 family monovalent cation:H+ antiporter